MKKLLGLFAVVVAAVASSIALAQLYPLFGPSTGILKGNVNSPQTSAAAASDVANLFGCGGSATLFPNGAGGCTAPSGSGTFATPPVLGSTTPNAGAFNLTNSDNESSISMSGTQVATGAAAVGIRSTQVFAPNGATNVDVIQLQPHLNTANGTNIANFEGVFLASMTIDSAYAGTTPALTWFESCNVYNDNRTGGTAANPATNFRCYSADPITNAVAATASGTFTNIDFNAGAATGSSASSAATVINVGAYINLGSGSSTGTGGAANTVNRGIFITGSGGATATNWAILSNSPADSELTGGLDATPLGAITPAAGTFTSVTVNNQAAPITTTNSSSTNSTVLQMGNNQAGSSMQVQVVPTGASSSTCGGLGSGATAPCGQIETASSAQTMPLYIGANGYPGLAISTASGVVSLKGWGTVNGYTDITPDKGTFTVTLTGMTGTTTGTLSWAKMGQLVTVCAASAITGTSNATTMTLTGIPSEIQPATMSANIATYGVEDSGVASVGYINVAAASGTWTAIKLAVSGSVLTAATFTSTGTKGLANATCWTYSLN